MRRLDTGARATVVSFSSGDIFRFLSCGESDMNEDRDVLSLL